MLKSLPDPRPDVATAMAGWLHSRPDLQRIALFAALPGEPDLLPLLDLEPNRTWCFPRVLDGQNLIFHEIRDTKDLTPAAFGIREPAGDAPVVAVDSIDAFLCPGLAFDRHGGRLGRGRGYYDRILASARKDALRIGVCFENQIVGSTFVDAHDVPMDFVICETGIIPQAE